MGASGRSVPPHAVRETSRSKPHLGVAKSLADFPQHLVSGDAYSIDFRHGMAAGHGTVDRVEDTFNADGWIGQINQKKRCTFFRHGHHNPDLCSLGTRNERFASLNHPVVAEARRRIAILEKYLAIERPAVSDADANATRIGVSRTQFYNLAEAWKLRRDPRELGLIKGYTSSRDYGVDACALHILDEEVVRTQSFSTLVSAVAARCLSGGFNPPSDQTIRDRLREWQALEPNLDGPRRLLVSRTWFHLPVRGLASRVMPVLLSATLIPERLIVAHELSLDETEPPDLQRLLMDLQSLCVTGAHKRGLLLDPADRRHANRLLENEGWNVERGWTGSIQREASRHFAGRLSERSVMRSRISSSSRPMRRSDWTKSEKVGASSGGST